MKKIIKYVFADILKNRILLLYTLFLGLASFSLLGLEDNSTKGLLSLMNILLLIVPLVSIIFSTIYLYNSAEFIELLVSQPIRRPVIWLSLYCGLSGSLTIAQLIGIGIPVFFMDGSAAGALLVAVSVLLSAIFSALAFLAGAYTRDKARGIGLAILAWLYFSVLFDGLVLALLFQFSDYPLEKPMMVIAAFNPVDLSRILLLMQMNVSAMMGFTGAVFRQFFGTTMGIFITLSILLIWIILPVYFANRRFNRKDL